VAPADYWAGFEHLVEPRQVAKRMVSFGFAVPKWRTEAFYEAPAIGRLAMRVADFDPELWKPRVSNPAFLHARPEDKFWAARKLAAMTIPLIRAAVSAGEFGDPAAEEFLVHALAARRDAILRAYLPAVNPIDAPGLDADGRLSFRNAAVDANVARAPDGYRAAWARFDNTTRERQPLGETFSTTTSVRAPVPLPGERGGILAIEVSAIGAPRDSWAAPVTVYFRRQIGGWQLVGLERIAETATPR
jgi:hypothetical protein